jgi:DNA-binding beta-propeller fold protein YncE
MAAHVTFPLLIGICNGTSKTSTRLDACASACQSDEIILFANKDGSDIPHTNVPRKIIFSYTFASLTFQSMAETMKRFFFVIRMTLAVLSIHSSMIPVAFSQSVSVSTYDIPTLGNPTSAIATRNGHYVFVSVTNVGAPNYSGPDSSAGSRKDVISGIQVFSRNRSSHSRVDTLRSIGFIRTGSAGANGLVLLRGEKTLATGVGDEGVAFLNVHDSIRGIAKPFYASQGEGAGTFDVVASPDGKYVFSANEYGMVQGQRGSVGIISVDTDRRGNVTHPHTIRQIPVGDVVPSLTISPDGSRIYVATELVPSQQLRLIAGADNPELVRHDCVQKAGTVARANGFITIIDTLRSIDPAGNAILSQVAAGCSPVRLTENADSSELYVSARGSNEILCFSPRLLESDPEHALLRLLPSAGIAPVGIRLFNKDRMLAVANSNRFAEANETVAIFDLSETKGSTRTTNPLSPIQSWSAGLFPRNIAVSASGRVLYLANYTSRTLQIIRTSPSLLEKRSIAPSVPQH